MDNLPNVIKAHASSLDETLAQPRFGLVSSVDSTRATVRVQLQPEGVLTGWLPVLSPWTGPGWGMWCPPSPGDQVLVLPQEGAAEHGVVVGSAFSLSETCPPALAGEFWLVHSSGSFLKLTNDGTIHVNGPLSLTGNLSVAGNIQASGTVADGHGALSGLRQHYDAHTHTDSRGGTTSEPAPQD